MIQVLNWSTPYLVLRNFDFLPERIDDIDIDFLCDNFQRLASTLGMFQLTEKNKPYKGKIKVGGQIVPTDIRFVGDGYFDQTWQQTVLSKRVRINGVYVPREDDHFFTLLHHALVHKDNVKPEYRKRLAKLATSAAVSASSDVDFEDQKTCWHFYQDTCADSVTSMRWLWIIALGQIQVMFPVCPPLTCQPAPAVFGG